MGDWGLVGDAAPGSSLLVLDKGGRRQPTLTPRLQLKALEGRGTGVQHPAVASGSEIPGVLVRATVLSLGHL